MYTNFADRTWYIAKCAYQGVNLLFVLHDVIVPEGACFDNLRGPHSQGVQGSAWGGGGGGKQRRRARRTIGNARDSKRGAGKITQYGTAEKVFQEERLVC